MIIIEIYHKSTCVEVKVRTKFIDDGGHKYHLMHKLGFKFNKFNKTYQKFYRDTEYTKERFGPDLKEVTKIFDSQTMLRRFKLVEEKMVA